MIPSSMPVKGPSKPLAAAAFALVALGVAAFDLWTKHAIFELLEVDSAGAPPRVVRQERFVVIEGLFELEANYNYGAFHGWFSEHTGLLALLSAAALLVILAILVHQLRQPRGPGLPFALALALLWGGTLGNLHDRHL
ncbi:MAG: signal peptidase II, partial [Planctomycetes bacterium]|nr:signal peptidase II [Planctomycetota bacterium]